MMPYNFCQSFCAYIVHALGWVLSRLKIQFYDDNHKYVLISYHQRHHHRLLDYLFLLPVSMKLTTIVYVLLPCHLLYALYTTASQSQWMEMACNRRGRVSATSSTFKDGEKSYVYQYYNLFVKMKLVHCLAKYLWRMKWQVCTKFAFNDDDAVDDNDHVNS